MSLSAIVICLFILLSLRIAFKHERDYVIRTDEFLLCVLDPVTRYLFLFNETKETVLLPEHEPKWLNTEIPLPEILTRCPCCDNPIYEGEERCSHCDWLYNNTNLNKGV